ncbi:ferritin-like domain-containing protein [Cohnella pontilimi]|uniref:Ferritin-like domain-containing protein n=1 Tax=Cohnella pontilimi TaxID=2564100 RepID=A0A4V5LSC5_9BACL|nr:ferritin-like domain-containing protein [Cohnella pontilimi]TJY42269.1 ferritin-like domain-containing protein [Cohnella pontilimi]
MYDYGYDFRPQADPTLIQNLTKAINGEYSAISCYERLARLAPNEEVRRQILEIRQDEIRHFHIFSQIYTVLTGRQPVPQITESCPAEYRAGLQFAFKDEQDTVDFYLAASDQARDPFIKESFRRIAADEQNHAVWFLYFLIS